MKKRIAVLLILLMLALPVAAVAGNWDQMNWDEGCWYEEAPPIYCFISALLG